MVEAKASPQLFLSCAALKYMYTHTTHTHATYTHHLTKATQGI